MSNTRDWKKIIKDVPNTKLFYMLDKKKLIISQSWQAYLTPRGPLSIRIELDYPSEEFWSHLKSLGTESPMLLRDEDGKSNDGRTVLLYGTEDKDKVMEVISLVVEFEGLSKQIKEEILKFSNVESIKVLPETVLFSPIPPTAKTPSATASSSAVASSTATSSSSSSITTSLIAPSSAVASPTTSSAKAALPTTPSITTSSSSITTSSTVPSSAVASLTASSATTTSSKVPSATASSKTTISPIASTPPAVSSSKATSQKVAVQYGQSSTASSSNAIKPKDDRLWSTLNSSSVSSTGSSGKNSNKKNQGNRKH